MAITRNIIKSPVHNIIRPIIVGDESSSPPTEPFDPLNTPALALCLFSTDPATLVPGTGNSVAQWSNTGSEPGQAIQPTATEQAKTGTRTFNGLNVLEFDGTDDGYNVSPVINVASGHTIFAVGATDTPSKSGTQNFVRGLASTSTRQQLGYFNSGAQIAGMNGSAAALADIAADGNPHIFSQTSFGPTLYLYYEGALVATASTSGAATITNLGIGRRGNSTDGALDGWIGAVLIYNRALNGDEANQVGHLLADLFNLSWTDYDFSTIVTFGDSITAGSLASTADKRWANLVATALGSGLNNQGISGSYLQNTVRTSTGAPETNNGRDRYQSALLGGRKADKAYILYGVNDILNTFDGMTSTAFATQLAEVVAGLISGGYAPGDIILGTPPYFTVNSPDPSVVAAYNAAVLSIAQTYHTKFADVYQYMVDNGGSSLLAGDNLHPNDSGHAAIATKLLDPIQM